MNAMVLLSFGMIFQHIPDRWYAKKRHLKCGQLMPQFRQRCKKLTCGEVNGSVTPGKHKGGCRCHAFGFCWKDSIADSAPVVNRQKGRISPHSPLFFCRLL